MKVVKEEALPMVSIIIPFVKDRGYLAQALESIGHQTYKGEIEIIQAQSEENVGVNINNGFDVADGEIIKWLCDDDMIPPRAIEHVVKHFNDNPDIDFLHSQAQNIMIDGTVIGYHEPQRETFTARELAGKNFIHGGTVAYRRECLESQRWDEDLWTGEEYEYHIRLLATGHKIGYLPEVTYQYRKHHKQKSSRSNRNLKARIRAINKIKAKYKK